MVQETVGFDVENQSAWHRAPAREANFAAMVVIGWRRATNRKPEELMLPEERGRAPRQQFAPAIAHRADDPHRAVGRRRPV